MSGKRGLDWSKKNCQFQRSQLRSKLTRHNEKSIGNRDLQQNTVTHLVYKYLEHMCDKMRKRTERNNARSHFQREHVRRKKMIGVPPLGGPRSMKNKMVIDKKRTYMRQALVYGINTGHLKTIEGRDRVLRISSDLGFV